MVLLLTSFSAASEKISLIATEAEAIPRQSSCISEQLKLTLFAPGCKWGSYIDSFNELNAAGFQMASYASVCEGCSLLIILLSFLVWGVCSIKRFFAGSTGRTTHVERRNNKVRLQIVVTSTTVLITFFIRCLFAVVLAASRRSKIPFVFDKSSCGSALCRPCEEKLGFVLQTWLWLFPAFSFSVFLLSSPVTKLITIWGMTSDYHLQNLDLRFKKKSSLLASMRSMVMPGDQQ
jgi:hypothetical protein